MQPQDPIQPQQPPINPSTVPPANPMVGQDFAQPTPSPQVPPSPQAQPQPPEAPVQPTTPAAPMPQPQNVVTPVAGAEPIVQPGVVQPTAVPESNPQPFQSDTPAQGGVYAPSVDPLPVQPPKRTGSRKLQVISLVILLIVLVFSMSGGFFLFDRFRDNSTSESTMNETTASLAEEETASTTPSTTDKTAEPATEKETVINKTITDEALGTTIKVNKVRRNIPFNADLSGLNNSQTSFAVEVTVSAGEKYGSTISGSNFRLIAGSKTVYESDVPFEDYITKKKLTVLETPTRGKTATGWLFYYVPNDQADEAILRYTRAEAKIIGGSGGTVPAKQADIAL